MNKIPAEEAANILNSWYRAIEENDTEQSVRLFKQAKPLIKEMEESEAFLTYYALLEEMHNGMPDDNRGEGYGDSHLISYYFHLFSGAYESYKKNDQQAIGFYKTAEKKLAHVDDPIEAARFHEKIGKLYYDLGENLMSLSHTRQAMEIFQDHGGYAMNLVSVYMTMADNYTEMGKKRNNFWLKQSKQRGLQTMSRRRTPSITTAFFIRPWTSRKRALHIWKKP